MPRTDIRIRLSVDPATVVAPNTPASVEVDLSELAPGQSVDPRSIRLWLGDEDVPVRLSDDFRFGARGRVHFVIEDPRRLEYVLTVGSGAEATGERRYVPAIGIGDALHHNTGQPMPCPLGWGAQISDLSGDGTPHLTIGTHWTTHFGWPMNSLHHRVCESEGDLIFGDVAALRARGPDASDPEVISEDFYVRHHIVDWDRDGRPDMVTINSGKKVVKFYRNTGRPGPVFDLVWTYQTEGGEGYQGLWLVDLFGDGRLHLMTGGQEKLPGHETEPDFSYIRVHRNVASGGRTLGT
jgi:hypothetical protein